MKYYIMLPFDIEEFKKYIKDSEMLALCLGDASFNTFYPDQGFDALYNILQQSNDLIFKVTIIDEKSNIISIEEFLKIIESLNIKKQ